MTWRLSIPMDPLQRSDPSPRAKGGLRNDDDYKLWLRQAGMYVKAYRPREPFPGPVLLAVTFHVRAPKSMRPEVRGLPHRDTPDLDRYLHALQDALTKGGVWGDDRQVSASFAVKVWAVDAPRIDVLVCPYEERVSSLLDVAYGPVSDTPGIKSAERGLPLTAGCVR